MKLHPMYSFGVCGKRRQRQMFRHSVYLFAAIGIALVTGSRSHAETWAARLGFPADKKVILLHMHDAGLCYETNAAVEQLAEQNLVQSVSTMVTCPWFLDSVSWAKKHEDFDVGLQFVLNSELPRYRWQPIAPYDAVASLVNPQGNFWPLPLQTMVNGDVNDVNVELEAQFVRAQMSGLQPTHLTTHLGALFSRLEYAEAYLSFSLRHWIPAVVMDLTPVRLEKFRSQGYPLPDELIQLIDDYPLPKVDELRILGQGDSVDQKRQEFLDLIRDLPPGLTQIACAPAIHSSALERIDDQWQQRVWEMELLSDPELKETLQQEGVIFTNWREIMRRFTGSP